MIKYFWSSFECEICKQQFPFKFKTKTGRKYTLFEYPLDKSQNYLVLESINIEKTSPTQKYIFMLTPSLKGDRDYGLGRGNE